MHNERCNDILYAFISYYPVTAPGQLLDVMRDLDLRMQRLLNAKLKAQGTSAAQLKLLGFIDRSASSRWTDVGEALGYSPRTITEAIDCLERESLVTRLQDPADRRVKHINITQNGESVLRKAMPVKEAFAKHISDRLDYDDQQTLIKLLDKLDQNLTELGA